MFKKILAFFMTAVIAASALCVTAGAADKIKLNKAKSVSSGKRVSATMTSGKPVDYKITLDEKTDLTINFSANVGEMYIYLYDASLKSVSPVKPTITKGRYVGEYLDDRGNWGYLGDGIGVGGDASYDLVGKLVFKKLPKGTYYVRFYRGMGSSGSGELNVTMSFSDNDASGDDGSSDGDFDIVLYLDEGDSIMLGAMSGTKEKSVSWSSSNEKVATVTSKGKVKAKKEGTAIITAKSGSTKKTIKIIVED